MPTLPPVPHTLEMLLDYSVGADSHALTRLHFDYGGGAPSITDATAIAAHASTAAGTNLKPLQSANTSITNIQVTDLSIPSGARGNAAGPGAGTRAGASVPAGVAVLVNGTILRRYRGGKPRSYFPWGVAGDLGSLNTWGAGAVTAFQTGYAAFLAAMNGFTAGTTTVGALVSVSYYSGYTLGPAAPGGFRKRVATPRAVPVVDGIGTVVVNPIVASQRRRNLHRT
jgi:hypothetical protein